MLKTYEAIILFYNLVLRKVFLSKRQKGEVIRRINQIKILVSLPPISPRSHWSVFHLDGFVFGECQNFTHLANVLGSLEVVVSINNFSFLYPWNRNRVTDIENRFVVVKRRVGVGGQHWKFGISRCKLIYIYIYGMDEQWGLTF